MLAATEVVPAEVPPPLQPPPRDTPRDTAPDVFRGIWMPIPDGQRLRQTSKAQRKASPCIWILSLGQEFKSPLGHHNMPTCCAGPLGARVRSIGFPRHGSESSHTRAGVNSPRGRPGDRALIPLGRRKHARRPPDIGPSLTGTRRVRNDRSGRPHTLTGLPASREEPAESRTATRAQIRLASPALPPWLVPALLLDLDELTQASPQTGCGASVTRLRGVAAFADEHVARGRVRPADHVPPSRNHRSRRRPGAG